MAFPLTDLRRTFRRNRSDDSVYVYPRLLRGAAALPKIEIAIRYFESTLGRRRGEMQPNVLVEFFGDPRLARCIVACLTRTYRYRVRDFAEVVGEAARRRLAEDGIEDARALRLRLYRLANELRHGFIPPSERAALLAPLLERWGLTGEQFEELLGLDAEESRLLERYVEAPPEPRDVAALYNYHTVETLLRAASRVTLDAPALDRRAVKLFGALLRRHGVAGRVERQNGGARFTLWGRQDALGSWTRHGGRLVRVLVRLIAAQPIESGAATVELAGKSYRLRVDGDALDVLGARGPDETAVLEAPVAGSALEQELRRGLAELRRQGLAAGWTVRSDPEPVVLDQCVFLPDLALAGRGRRVLIALAATPAA